ncbi:histidine kinase [Kitasatospora sp. NBC_01287]|uniref:sensor histidine kinase n=1 Tax=Kitasatospora sp. NBC_01287 TaxID=2903573 RepID=UPI0022563A02|nr:histidine kinase [Kitasatospora sp. NBC_01287]MCX4749866.1 histidine kinase [Kitasatospora sp. NBC_01287]
MERIALALVGRRARVRWVHLVLGGALLMPFWMLAMVPMYTLFPGRTGWPALLVQLLCLPIALPMAWVAGLLPVVRVLVSTAARALAAPAAELAGGPARGWAARRRTAHWFTLHLLLGGVVSGMSISVPPAVLVLWFTPHTLFAHPATPWVRRLAGAPLLLGTALLLLLLGTSAAAGALLARRAPALLGPSPAERLAAAERRAAVLAQRNRLARELHDSVGHALSAVSIQAAAAARVLHRDPAFAAEALAAIEEVAREAVGELDTVLGVLREEEGEPALGAGPTLAGLEPLVRQLALAGVAVETHTGAGLALLPAPVSREAYRIVQEGLTNVLRHAGPVPATLRLDLRDGRLDVELTNALGAGRPSRPGGGRGLRGVAERAAALRGGCESGRTADGAAWRLAVWLPVTAGATGEAGTA